MIGFSNIFKAELYKIAKGKSLLKILIAVAIIFTATALLFSFLYNITGGIIPTMSPEGDTVTQEDVDAAKASYEYAQTLEDNMSAPLKMANTSVYSAKATYTLYKYMYENNLSFTSVRTFGSISLTTDGFILFILQVMAFAVAIYATVTIVKSFAGERSSGTLKMQLLKPISKEAMIMGKMLATWVVSIGVLLVTFLLAAIVGVCAYKVDPKSVLIVLNASHVIKSNAATELILYLFYYIIQITQYIVFGMFMSNLIKKSESAALAVSLVVLLIGATIERFLGYIFIGYIGMDTNLNWLETLTLSGPSLNYMNLYSMLAISIAWLVGMFAFSIFAFKKADINS